MKIEGHGGYLFTPPGYYNESSHSFEIFFDDEPVGSINCYANSCRGSVTLPEGTKPGEHALAVDGGLHVARDDRRDAMTGSSRSNLPALELEVDEVDRDLASQRQNPEEHRRRSRGVEYGGIEPV